jgi:hypothetical protein
MWPQPQVQVKPLFGGLTKGPTGVFKSVLDTTRTGACARVCVCKGGGGKKGGGDAAQPAARGHASLLHGACFNAEPPTPGLNTTPLHLTPHTRSHTHTRPRPRTYAHTDGRRRDEIYVDVVERLSITFNATGNMVSCQVDGAIQVRARVCAWCVCAWCVCVCVCARARVCLSSTPHLERSLALAPANPCACTLARSLASPSPPPHTPRATPAAAAAAHAPHQVKSYLSGNPPIKIKLNDDLLIARRDGSSGAAGGLGGASGFGSGGFRAGDYAADSLVILEDANFHEVRVLHSCVWVCQGGGGGAGGVCVRWLPVPPPPPRLRVAHHAPPPNTTTTHTHRVIAGGQPGAV